MGFRKLSSRWPRQRLWWLVLQLLSSRLQRSLRPSHRRLSQLQRSLRPSHRRLSQHQRSTEVATWGLATEVVLPSLRPSRPRSTEVAMEGLVTEEALPSLRPSRPRSTEVATEGLAVQFPQPRPLLVVPSAHPQLQQGSLEEV